MVVGCDVLETVQHWHIVLNKLAQKIKKFDTLLALNLNYLGNALNVC